MILGPPNEGTCLDLALLFCGLCFGYELLPWVIVIDGHALAAVSLTHGRADWKGTILGSREKINDLFKKDPLRTVDPLLQLIDSKAYVAIECTGFAYIANLPDSMPEGMKRQEGFLSFENAIETGRKQLEQRDRPFQFALDIAVAHYSWELKPHKIELPTSDKTPTNRGMAAISEVVRNMGKQSSATRTLQFATLVVIVLFFLMIFRLMIRQPGDSGNEFITVCGAICIVTVAALGYLLISQYISRSEQSEIRNMHDEVYNSLRPQNVI
jgi:hypothetical protein